MTNSLIIKIKSPQNLKKLLLSVMLLLIPVVFTRSNYAMLICGFIGIYIIAVSGLDILFGYNGQISMGHAAFFAIGAYGSALLHSSVHIPAFFTMIIAAVGAAAIGALLAYPASKLVFHFLSLATIAFGEIIYQLVAQSPGGITGNFTGFFTGPISIFGFPLDTNTRFYYFALVAVAIFLIAKQCIIDSKVGRAFIAIRENHHAADGMGINVRKYKVIAFATSAFFTAYAGAMYAHFVGFISPDTFMQKQSVMFLTMMLFGGAGTKSGPVIGVICVLMLNEGLRFAERYQMLVYGVLLLLVVLVMPGGVAGSLKKLWQKRKAVN